MEGFEGVEFQGTFRNYQKRVLDNVEKYLEDGKINIVAAPGSGKTVLGLELIRRIGEPCLILSPTTIMREQWGQRFRELFVTDENRFEELFSTDLHQVKLVNSITYQALYSAMEHIALNEEDEVDCSDIDLRYLIKKYKIKTICLEEPHHLKKEWENALERFRYLIGQNVKRIFLSTPPLYDYEETDRKRYHDLCGEIDEEIFAPELVAEKTLCPHQDYVYFNYPTQDEIVALREFEERAKAAVDEVDKLEGIGYRLYYCDYEHAKESISVAVLRQYYGYSVDKKEVEVLTGKTELPKPDMSYFEAALQFLLERLWPDEEKDKIRNILVKHQVYSKKKVNLVWSKDLQKELVSSVGKLESISSIAKHEYQTMGKALRMLILTDYIRNDRENLSKIGTEEAFNVINVVSIFETLRRAEDSMNIGVLSGTLVILPQSIDLGGILMEKISIPGTRYCIVDVFGAAYEAMDLVTQLFQEGKIQILIGTKSLLGQEWDESCVNSLILAGFADNDLSSSQMRGRVIRADKTHPDKTVNIWHLVTLEPRSVVTSKEWKSQGGEQEEKVHLKSWNLEILKHSFDSFMGPNYETGVIESGINRMALTQLLSDGNGMVEINRKMLERSKEREAMKDMWKKQLESKSFHVVMETRIPQERKVPPKERVLRRKSFWDFLRKELPQVLEEQAPPCSLGILGEVLAKTLRDCKMISEGAEVYVKKDDAEKEVAVGIQLRKASVHDQNIFSDAMIELLSPIAYPHYLLIQKEAGGQYRYKYSFACPTVIGQKKEYVEVLARNLKERLESMEVIDTLTKNGYTIKRKCRRESLGSRFEAWKSDTMLTEPMKKYIVVCGE